MQERLQKILSARGICSRRKAEEYIERGLVKVNGVVCELGQKADPEIDKIEVDGEVLEEQKNLLYFVMFKPKGVVTSNVEKREKDDVLTVRDLLPAHLQGKIYPVGRLDKDSEGILLFTNDGALANRLLHPRFEHEKEYIVETEEPITRGQLRKISSGVNLKGKKTKEAKVQQRSPKKFRITLTEGRNRQIRRMVQKVGGSVQNLARVRIETLEASDIQSGDVRELTKHEKDALLQAVGLR